MADIRIKIEPYEERRDRKYEWHLAVALLRHFTGISERRACDIVFDMVKKDHGLHDAIAVRMAVRRVGIPTAPFPVEFVSRRR